MKTILSITPLDNVNFAMSHVIDPRKNKSVIYDTNSMVRVYDSMSGKVKEIKVADVSHYDERLILDGHLYHILNMVEQADTVVKESSIKEMPDTIAFKMEAPKSEPKSMVIADTVETTDEVGDQKGPVKRKRT